MAQTAEQRRANAKRTRLMLLYRIIPEEQDAVEQYQRKDRTLRILLTKGNAIEEGRLYNDHRHSDGLYRGRLSYLINKALGTIENTYKERTSAILRALADYLDNPPAVRVIGERWGLLGRAKKKRKMVYGKAPQ